MIFHLIKKDLFLAKKYLFITMALAIAIPLFFSWRAPSLLGFFSILMSVILVEVLLLGNILTEEEKYPNAEMLLCSSPYTRFSLVLEKYILVFVIFICCCIEYNSFALIFDNIASLYFKDILIILIINTFFFGIFMPLQYKLGIQGTKLILSVGAFAIPLLLTSIKNYFNKFYSITKLNNISDGLQIALMIFAVFLIAVFSFLISYKIYINKEF